MTFTDFIEHTAPEYCGVHPSYGEIALLVFEAEQFGNIAFAQESFKTMRERAMMVVPYRAESKPDTHEHVLNFAEYMGCVHRQNAHGEDYNERIGQLSEKIKETNPGWIEDISIKGGWS